MSCKIDPHNLHEDAPKLVWPGGLQHAHQHAQQHTGQHTTQHALPHSHAPVLPEGDSTFSAPKIWRKVWRRISRIYRQSWLYGLQGGGRSGLLILIAITLLTLAAPLVCSHSPQLSSGPALSPPSRLHLLGTDELGVDLWAQLVYGARISLTVGLATALLAGIGGAIIGIIAGYRGGWVDRLLMRLIDIILVLPDLPVMIVLAAFFGPSLTTIIVVLSMFSWVSSARIVRSRVLVLRERTYIKVASSYGASSFYLLRRHFLPEIFPLAAVSMVRLAGRAIVAEAGLSFLGLGDPTSRSWGLIIHHALSFGGIYYTDFWKWWLLFPWLALTLVVTGLALLGRDLERMADPRIGGK